MNERDMLCSRPRAADGQLVQNCRNPEPCNTNLMRSTSNFCHFNQVSPPSGSMNSYDRHPLPGHVAFRRALHGMTQDNQQNHRVATNPDSGARLFPVPNNHGIIHHLPYLSNRGDNVGPLNEHGRSNYTVEGVGDLCKRRRTLGNSGNLDHLGASAGPSASSAAAMTRCHFDTRSASMEAPGPGAWHRPSAVGLHMDSGMVHSYRRVQPLQPPSFTYLNQHFISNAGSLPRYPERLSNRHPANFLLSPPVAPQHHILHSSQNIQGMRGYCVVCYPYFLAAPSWVLNDSTQHDVQPISQDNSDSTNQLIGNGIYGSQGRNHVYFAPSGHLESQGSSEPATHEPVYHARFRFDQESGRAILEEYNPENANFNGMGLDLEIPSYELLQALLALNEQMETASTGITEEDMTCHLKTKRYNATGPRQEKSPCINQDNDSCIICLDEYEDNDKLGSLDCGHEYHLDCLEKWLLLKNLCPLCKSPALVMPRNNT